jgi:hypothetical protein
MPCLDFVAMTTAEGGSDWRLHRRRIIARQEFVYRCGGLESGASTCYPYASFPGSCPAYTTLITRGPS